MLWPILYIHTSSQCRLNCIHMEYKVELLHKGINIHQKTKLLEEEWASGELKFKVNIHSKAI